MLGEMLKAILITSLTGSLLAVLITILKPVTKRIFGFNWHYYIWLAVLFVMILPIRFTLPQSSADIPAQNTQMVQTDQITVKTDVADIRQNVNAANTITAARKATDFINNIIVNRMNYLGIIWLLGIVISLLINVGGYIRLIIKTHKNSVVISCPKALNYTNREITVRTGKDLSSPFMLGVFRPTLVLPDRELSDEQLDNILRHEMTHFRRKDILYKWFMLFVRSVHWFNPVVYYVARQINNECEISCDLSVVSRMNSDEQMSYINTILSLVLGDRVKRVPLTTQMASGKKALKRRFTMIKNVKKTRRYMNVISYVSAAAMLASAVFAGGLLCGCVNSGKDISVNNTAQEQSDQTKDSKQLYTELYDIQDGQYVCQTDDFCITLPDNIKLEEYDLIGSAPNDIEKLWNVNMLSNGEISIQIQNRVIDIPESEEVLKQRFADNHEKNENPYSTGEYKITYFMRNLYPDFPPDYGIMGYRYMVEFSDRGYKYVQEIPVSDTQTLRAVANINTSDESVKQSFIDTVQSIKTTDIIKAAYDAMF